MFHYVTFKDVDSHSTGRLSNLSQYGIGSILSRGVRQRYGSGEALASSRVVNRQHIGGYRSADRLNTISLQHFDHPITDGNVAGLSNRDRTNVKKLEIKVGSRHHSYPRIEQQSLSKSANRSIVSFQQTPDGTGRLSTIQLPVVAAAGTDGKRREKKTTKTKKPVAAASNSSRRAQCLACNEFYDVAHNPRGSCHDAPDEAVACIERVTCVCCVRASLYHCARDEDGQYEPICSCHSGSAGGRRRNCRKWMILTVLALFVPCLWCFLPVMACHDCCVARNNCGPRHREV